MGVRAKFTQWAANRAARTPLSKAKDAAHKAKKLAKQAAKIEKYKAQAKEYAGPGFFKRMANKGSDLLAEHAANKELHSKNIGFGRRVATAASHHKIATAATVTGLTGAGILAGRASKRSDSR